MTATGKDAQIYAALMDRVGTMALTPSCPVAYPDITFDPAKDAPNGRYIEVRYFPNRPAWEGVSAGALDQGLLQLTLIMKAGQGILAPLELVAAIKAHFAKGTVMVNGQTKVTITREPWPSAPLVDATEVRTPITITWAA
jgi:hypothetical protein